MSFGVLFPGQGVQRPGMSKNLLDNYPVAREAFREASDALSIDMEELCGSVKGAMLERSDYAQPAILTHSVAASRALCHVLRLAPAVVAGHSVGELAALVVAGCIGFADAVRLVKKRGELMMAADQNGAMLAVEMDEPSRQQYVLDGAATFGLDCAAINSSFQVVISGNRAGIEALERYLADHPYRTCLLKVSSAFHSRMMAPTEDAFGALVSRLNIAAPTIPFISSVSGLLESDCERIKSLLVQQLTRPVMWRDAVMAAGEIAAGPLIDVSPSATLKGLFRRERSPIVSSFEDVVRNDGTGKLEPALCSHIVASTPVLDPARYTARERERARDLSSRTEGCERREIADHLRAKGFSEEDARRRIELAVSRWTTGMNRNGVAHGR